MLASARHYILKKIETIANWSKSTISLDRENFSSVWHIFFAPSMKSRYCGIVGSVRYKYVVTPYKKYKNTRILPDPCTGFSWFIVIVIETVTHSKGIHSMIIVIFVAQNGAIPFPVWYCTKHCLVTVEKVVRRAPVNCWIVWIIPWKNTAATKFTGL